ncbi:MAG: carbonate dehydratase [Sneathiella sp.]|jgi:carbonic anhydrase|uniref:carbonate dehydratase n=1 Tax=Sneathiella sp. TaxID=1964365 RepID=UPI000C374E55|nr:carbonate dehydratase [Sneathiella sp.]MAL80474.1 carbonate dehydratase [Sneathiella sp.]
MDEFKKVFEKNKAWAASTVAEDPDFFSRLAHQQSPEHLWIGCADSRVPANQIMDLPPGEVFVHRNIANIVVPSDLNCLSVLQYAVEVLKVRHIIICGHYGCGGIAAAMSTRKNGMIDNWLRHIRTTARIYNDLIEKTTSEKEKTDLLCELNVIEQVQNVCATTIVQDAWDRGQKFAVHGIIYSVADGLLKDLIHCEIGSKVTHGEDFPKSLEARDQQFQRFNQFRLE